MSTERTPPTPPLPVGYVSAATASATAEEAPRERLLRTAYDLFAAHGILATGIDRIVAEAGVAKMTLYRYFPSKEDLVLAVLDLREEVWSQGWLAYEAERRGEAPVECLLAIFDLFDEWFRRPDYEGCLFINSLTEMSGQDNRIVDACVVKRANIRRWVEGLATEAGVRDPVEFACRWQIVMAGAIVMALHGDTHSASNGRRLGQLLLEAEGLR